MKLALSVLITLLIIEPAFKIYMKKYVLLSMTPSHLFKEYNKIIGSFHTFILSINSAPIKKCV
jgi:hypothetical protein